MYVTQDDYVFKQLEECQTNESWYEINNENARYLYNYIKNLQQRNTKVIEVLNDYKKFCKSKLNFEKAIHSPTARYNESYWKNCVEKLNHILSILQGEEVKE